MLLYYIRHGDPIYDPDSLTPLGNRQAEAIGRRLSHVNFDRIFVSSSNRARQTAAPLCELLHKQAEILDWANESHTWDEFALDNETGNGKKEWAGYVPSFRKLFHSRELLLLGDRWTEHPAIKDTTMPAGVARLRRETDAFLLSLGYAHDAEGACYRKVGDAPERVAFFAHQGFFWAFMSTLTDIPYPVFATRFDTEHTGLSVIEFSEDREKVVIPKFLQISSDSHFYAENLPTRYNNKFMI